MVTESSSLNGCETTPLAETSAMILFGLASRPYLLCTWNYSEISGFILLFTPNLTPQ